MRTGGYAARWDSLLVALPQPSDGKLEQGERQKEDRQAQHASGHGERVAAPMQPENRIQQHRPEHAMERRYEDTRDHRPLDGGSEPRIEGRAQADTGGLAISERNGRRDRSHENDGGQRHGRDR
jgi:hypothetical protein